MKVAIYTRVASFHPLESQGGHGRQERACREFAEDREWEVVDVYADTGMSRGERDRMLQDGMSGDFDAIVTWDLSRLARRAGDMEPVLDSGLRLVTANGQFDSSRPADAFVARMSAGMSTGDPDVIEVERREAAGPITLF